MELNFNKPILLLIFNRPDTTFQVLQRIREIRPKYLFVAADGPRAGREDDQINCELTRDVIRKNVDWDCELKTLFRNENLGCGFGVCSAITWFFDQVESGIILEDDCLPDLSFFQFCDEILDKYKDDSRIFGITGTNVQNGALNSNDSYFFSNYPITWGWASWRRAWKHFRYEIPDYISAFKSGELDHFFQSRGEKKYWMKKIKMGVTEKQNIWDYQWWFAIWKNKGMIVTPNCNLILNLGFRDTGSHTFLHDSKREPTIEGPVKFPLNHPIRVSVDREADKRTFLNAYSHSFSRIFRLIRENGWWNVIKYTTKRLGI